MKVVFMTCKSNQVCRLLAALHGTEMCGVLIAPGYPQLHFESSEIDYWINIYGPVELYLEGKPLISYSDVTFLWEMSQLILVPLKEVHCAEDECLKITFVNNALLRISLDPKESETGEAVSVVRKLLDGTTDYSFPN